MRSATGMNSPGWTRPRSRWCQRISASTPSDAAARQLARAAGSAARTRRGPRRARSAPRASDSAGQRLARVASPPHRPAVAAGCLARYIAMSARLSSVVGVGAGAPRTTRCRCSRSRRPRPSEVQRHAQRRRAAARRAAIPRLLRRACRQVGHQHQELVAALAGDDVGRARHLAAGGGDLASSSSPTAWPKLSFTSLKSSRSRKSTRSSSPVRRQRASASSTCSAKCGAIGQAGERIVVGELRELPPPGACARVMSKITPSTVGHLTVVAEDRAALLVNPARATVAMDHAVLEHERLAARHAGVHLLFDEVAIVRVDHARVRARVVADEVLRRVAGDALDLAAHELTLPVAGVRAAIDRAGHVGHQRLEELLVPHRSGVGFSRRFFRRAGRRTTTAVTAASPSASSTRGRSASVIST